MRRKKKPKPLTFYQLTDSRVRVGLVKDDWVGRVIFLPRRVFDKDIQPDKLGRLGQKLIEVMGEAKHSITLTMSADVARKLGTEVANYCLDGRCQWAPQFNRRHEPDACFPWLLECPAILMVEALWRHTPYLLSKFDSGQVKFKLTTTATDWSFRLSWHPDYHPLFVHYCPPKDLDEWE